MEEATIIHDVANNAFRTEEGAILSYTMRDGAHVFDHTVVPPECRGKGLAGQLARYAFEHARSANWRVVAECSYIETYLQRHPEFQELLVR